MTNLENLLFDIAIQEIPANGLQKAFDKVALSLLRDTVLVAGEVAYLLQEIEFYFSSPYYNHEDSYVHANQYSSVQRQHLFGEWYFHRYGSKEKYRRQKFRGLDICFGNQAMRNAGGILLRSMRVAGSGTVISGIGRLVECILTEAGDDAVEKAATLEGKLVFD